MYNMSDGFNAAFADEQRARPIARAIIGATTYTTESGAIADMELEESLGDGNGTLPLGETGSAELKLTLHGVSADGLSGLTVQPSMTLQGRNDWCPLGVFRVEGISSPDNYDTIELTCYDGMYYADRTPYRSSLTFPATLQAVYNEVLAQAGMQGLGGNVIAGFTVQEEPQGYSCRQMLGYIAGICGGCARMSRTGKLEIVKFAVVDATKASITGAQQYDDAGSLDHNTEVQIDGLQITCGSKVWQYSGGTDDAIASYDASSAQDRSVIANVYDNGDGTYQIEVSGEGAMYDWTSRSVVPWNQYISNTKTFTVGDGVTSIGAYSMQGGSKLTRVNMADSVTSIGAWAFRGCGALTYIYIGDGVTSIGDNAFQFCSKLDSIYLPETLQTIGSSAFADCALLAKTNAVVLPDALTTIGNSAFNSCSNMRQCDFGSGLTTIGGWAFAGCSKLQMVNLAAATQLTSIGTGAFGGCTSLASFVGGGHAALGMEVFRGDTALVSVTLSDGVTSISAAAFMGCSALVSLILPSALMSLGGEAFAGSGIKALTIPAALTDIFESISSYGTFAGAAALETIAVDAANPRYYSHDGCLYRDTRLLCIPVARTATLLAIKDGCTTIIAGAGGGMQYVTDIVVPASVTTIDVNAFDSEIVQNITIDKAQDSIYGSPWGATNATVTWTGGV